MNISHHSSQLFLISIIMILICEKFRYGLASAISQLDLEPSDRIDPMSEVTL